MPNPFRYLEAETGAGLAAEPNVLAYVTGAERRDSIWLDSTLATADADGNKYYEKGQVISKRAGTNKWSFAEPAVLTTAFDAANIRVGVLVTRVNVGFGDDKAAVYVGYCTFDVSALRNYVANATDVKKHLPTCTFYTVTQQTA
jgi:hypothetical protein